MRKNIYKSGDWNLICDVCGKKIKASESLHRWDGFIVCREDYETRHPQDFVRVHNDRISVPYSRPRPADRFLLTGALQDTVYIQDNDDSRDYLTDLSTYFAEDYLINYTAFSIIMNWIRSINETVIPTETLSLSTSKSFVDTVSITDSIFPRKTIRRTVTDTVSLVDSGMIFLENYVEAPYFLEDYVGTRYTFTV